MLWWNIDAEKLIFLKTNKMVAQSMRSKNEEKYVFSEKIMQTNAFNKSKHLSHHLI